MLDSINGDILHKHLVPKLEKQSKRNLNLHKFITLDDTMISIPSRSSEEHEKIAEYAKSPWGMKVVDSRIRRLKTSGFSNEEGSDSDAWRRWKMWKMIHKEKTAMREAVTFGEAFTETLKISPTLTLPVNKSPFTFSAFYGSEGLNDIFSAEYPVLAIEKLDGTPSTAYFKVWNDTEVGIFERVAGKDSLRLVEKKLHGADVAPFVRYLNDINSSGQSVGDVWPLRHILLRIMKASYDSGLINHNNSWHVRYVAGLSSLNGVPYLPEETPEEYQARVARMETGLRKELSTSDLLTSPDVNTKFGSLPATPPGGFVPVIEQMLRELAAVSDTPSDYLTGNISGQTAEQAANSQANFLAVCQEKKDVFGESNESQHRLDARITGREHDETLQCHWAENDNGAIAARVDALGKAKTMLNIPDRVLWEEFPNMTPEKLARWNKVADEQEAKDAAATEKLMMLGNENASAGSIARDAELEQ